MTRRKYAGGFSASMGRVLEIAGLRLGDVDRVAASFYQHPYAPGARSLKRLAEAFSGNANLSPPVTVIESHHRSHAASAFYQSPFERALVCVWDNEGSVIGSWEPSYARRSERHSYYFGEGSDLTLLEQELDGPDDVGFGQAYARFTRFVGLGDYKSAGKLMGLAAYGDPNRYSALGPLWEFSGDGRLTSVLRSRDGHMSVPLLFERCGIAPPSVGDQHGYERSEMRDLAALIQRRVEETAVIRISRLVGQTCAPAVCIAGGVGLNSVLNAKIQEAVRVPVYVPPHPDDTGQAIGNALLAQRSICEGTRQRFQRLSGTNALGGEFSTTEVQRRLKAHVTGFGKVATVVSDTVGDAAKMLAAGSIVGWFQGRSEYGARALGQRSILADPRTLEAKDKLNKLKGRELYRPVAPAVIEEAVNEFFNVEASPLWATMSGTAQLRPSALYLIPAAGHVDGTARLQVVGRGVRPLFHELLSAFGRITGVPILLNTSFNTAAEPIVETPEDAFNAALAMKLDVLYIADVRIDLS